MNDEPLPREIVRIMDDRDRFMAKHGLMPHDVHIALGFRLWSKWRAFLERQGVPHVTLLFGSPVRRDAEIHHDSWLVTGDAVVMFGQAARRTQEAVERAKASEAAVVAEDRERLRCPSWWSRLLRFFRCRWAG